MAHVLAHRRTSTGLEAATQWQSAHAVLVYVHWTIQQELRTYHWVELESSSQRYAIAVTN